MKCRSNEGLSNMLVGYNYSGGTLTTGAILLAGSENDVIFGGADNDAIHGQQGNDFLQGDSEND